MTVVVTGYCDICATDRVPIRAAVVAWVEPIRPTYEAVDRCDDAAACRARVEGKGEKWPVVERLAGTR